MIRILYPARSLILFLAYTAILSLSLWIAFLLRFDFFIPDRYLRLLYSNLIWVVPFQLFLLYAFGQFGGLLSFFRLPDLYRLFGALFSGSLILVYLWYFLEGRNWPPRSVILGDLIFSLMLICGFRVGLRVARERFLSASGGGRELRRRRVAVLGAGDAGASVAADLLSRRGLGMSPVVFLDDDKSKWKKTIHGILVAGGPGDLADVRNRYAIEAIIIALPSASTRRIREVTDAANAIGLETEIVPSLAELTTGKVKANRVRPVEIEDILGRDPVELDSKNIEEMLVGKVVMVTGAGGSIGGELCRQIAFRNPRQLILVEQSEIQLFQIEQQLLEEGYEKGINALLADVLDEARIHAIFEEFEPEIVFHAAAHKHVYLTERQPAEVVKNNTLGTRGLADLASEFAVERFVFISTDKAINPTSVMGASKRLAEIYIQSKQMESPNSTRFMAVRFGNVLGSSGSVVPIFRKQITRGGPVTVTHPEVSRYFMTVTEAVGLVLQSATQGSGGEIFVLDMGSQVKIVDLARQMIELSGFRPEVDIEIEYIGLRPGEKLYEEVQHGGETLEETAHPRISRLLSEARPNDAVDQFFEMLPDALNGTKSEQLKETLKEFVPEYEPYLE